MPLSPLTRLLIVLTLLAFPWVFVTMMEPRSWLAPGLLGIAMSLWTAALFGIVKSGAAFDERAFHSTRPNGQQRAFVRSSVVMLGVMVIVSLMAGVRGWYYNLGWQATWAGVVIVFSLMFLFTAAVAAGFNLCFNQVRDRRWVGWIMFAMPTMMHIVNVEMKDRNAWPGAAVFTAWTSGFSPAVITAATLCGVAWWLSAKQRMWWFSLIIAGTAGLCLVAVSGARFADPEMPGPPTRVIEIRRSPLIDTKANAGWVKGSVRIFDFANFLTVDGLANDEIVGGIATLPLPVVDEYFSRMNLRSSNGFRLLDWQRDDQTDLSQRDMVWILSSQLPSRPKPEGSHFAHYGDGIPIDADEVASVLRQVEQEDWEFTGTIHRIVHQCELPLFKGGSRAMKAFGHVTLRPAYQIKRQLIVPYRMVFPALRFDPNHRYSTPGLHNHALIVNRSRTATVKSEPWYLYGNDSGVASTWINSTFQFPMPILWSANELEGATIHIFTTHPVASVRMTVPPPER